MSKLNILLTGSTGFLGGYIKNVLYNSGCILTTVGRDKKNNLKIDLSKENFSFRDELFELIIHCAGKAHAIPKNEYEKAEFYAINVEGTKNLIKGLETLKIINIILHYFKII